MAAESSSQYLGLTMFRQIALSDDNGMEDLVPKLSSLFRKRQIKGSKECAEATALLLHRLVASSDCDDAHHLLAEIQFVSRELIQSLPRQVAISNMARRVLGLVREESEQSRHARSERSQDEETSDLSSSRSIFASRSSKPLREHDLPNTSMFQLLSRRPSRRLSERDGSGRSVLLPSGDGSDGARSMCQEVLEGIQELLDELRQVDDQIAAYALEHVHSNEIILTNSISTELLKFLTKAAGKRKFSIILTENNPNGGNRTNEALLSTPGAQSSKFSSPKKLANAGISVTLVPDSAVFGLMPRVSKTILTAEAVFADGSFTCDSGGHLIAMTARFHKIPILVLAGVFKISPQYPFDVKGSISYGSTGARSLDQVEDSSANIFTQHPVDDHIPAELVDLYISNVGAHSPNSLDRVISDHYRVEDSNTFD